jgi:hypothetical protein
MVLVLGTLSQAGCSLGPRHTGASFRGDGQDNNIRIFVTNLNFMDATLWAVTTGTRKKLGIVTGKRNAVYTIPWDGFLELHLEVDLLSGPRCTTESLPVGPGDNIELIIDVEMTQSPMCKWRRDE